MPAPWEDSSGAAATEVPPWEQPAANTPPWETPKPDLSKVQLTPLQQAQSQAGSIDPERIDDSMSPADVIMGRGSPAQAAAVFKTAAAVPGKVGELLRAGVTDMLDPAEGTKDFKSNLAASVRGEPLPVDEQLAQLSRVHPALATVSKIAQGVVGTAPLAVVGAEGVPVWAQRLVSLGFAGNMISGAGDAAKTLGTEMGKAPADRDEDKITSSLSDLVQSSVFAPLAGAHGLRDPLEEKLSPSSYLTRQLGQQLKNAPLDLKDPTDVQPLEKPAAAGGKPYQFPAAASFYESTPPSYADKPLTDLMGGVFRSPEGFIGSVAESGGRLVLDNGRQQLELPVGSDAKVADAGLRAVSLGDAAPKPTGQYPADPMPVLSRLQTSRNVARYSQARAIVSNVEDAAEQEAPAADAAPLPQLHPTSEGLINAVVNTAGDKKAPLDQLYGALQAAPTAKRVLEGHISRLEVAGAGDAQTAPFYDSLQKIESFENQYLDNVTKPAPVRGKVTTKDVLPAADGKPASVPVAVPPWETPKATEPTIPVTTPLRAEAAPSPVKAAAPPAPPPKSDLIKQLQIPIDRKFTKQIEVKHGELKNIYLEELKSTPEADILKGAVGAGDLVQKGNAYRPKTMAGAAVSAAIQQHRFASVINEGQKRIQDAAVAKDQAAIAETIRKSEELRNRPEPQTQGFGGSTRARPVKAATPAAIAATPAPSVHPIRQWFQNQVTGFKSIFAPSSLSPEARGVGNSIRHFMGENATAIARADEGLHSFRKEFDQTPVPADWSYDPNQPLPHNYAIIDALERDPSALPARYQDLAKTFHDEFAWRIAAIQKFAPNALQHLIANYFPHIWKDPKRAGDAMAQVATRLFSGRKEFLKERSLPYFKNGLERGLKPISDNPVDLLIAKMHSMDKFLLALKAQAEWKQSGAMKFKYLFERLPDGWQTVEDPAFVVQKPPVVTVEEAYDGYQRAKLGEILQDLGVSYKRVADLGGTRWAEADPLSKEIRAKAGASEDILWHELGHHLDWAHPDLRDALTFRGQGPVAQQLRALVDLNHPGRPHDPKKGYDQYLRSAPEKMAEIFRAYVHAPDLFQRTAPDVWTKVKGWLDTQPRLRQQLTELSQGSLDLKHETTEIKLGGMQQLGHWMMPDGAAQVVKNHLSPGLSQFAAFRTFKAASNILNAAQLGLSAFHVGFTSLDAAVSRLAIGLEDLSRAHAYAAAKTFASVPASPVTNILRGARLRQEALHPGTTDAETASLVKALEMAGGRIGQDRYWQTDFLRKLKRAWAEGTASGYLKSLPLGALAGVEQAMRPIMEYVVPRQKLGVFADMATRELQRLGPGASVVDTREAMRKAWDSVDNRMGQVVYDNLFYNHAVKDAALMSFRAYGWQLGKYREGRGALADTAGAAKALAMGERPLVSHRMAYAMALPITVGMIGGTINYLMTGQRPQSAQDLFMPRTGKIDANGNPARLNLPSYMKDVLAYGKHPAESFVHSLNPMFSAIGDLMANKDYYDVRIRNPDDPLWKQGTDVAKFALKQFVPFVVSGTQKLQELKAPIHQQILPFFGVTPAPTRMTMTPAQELAGETTAANMGTAPKTKEQFDRSKLIREIVQDFRNGQNSAARSELAKGFEVGMLNANSAKTLVDKLEYTPLQFQVHHMTVDAAMRIWRVANGPERTQLMNMIGQKVITSKTISEEDRKAFAAEIVRSHK